MTAQKEGAYASMAVIYLLLFGAIGAMAPFLTLYYAGLGLSGTEISILVSVPPAVLFLSQPFWAPLADRSGNRARMLGLLLLAAGLLGPAIALGRSFAVLIIILALWAFFSTALVPLTDSIALGEVQRTGTSYPKLRVWGSIGFLLVSAVTGWLYDYIPLTYAFVVYGSLLLLCLLWVRKLPAEGIAARRPGWQEIKALATNPAVLGFLLMVGLMQVTLAAHLTFYSVRLQEVGGDRGLVGLAWSLAALMEVPVFLMLPRYAKRFHPLSILAFASGLFSVRWYIYGLVAVPSVLIWLQITQAFTFALFLPTAIVYMGELTPPALRSSGQGLLVLVTGGFANVVGNLTAGYLVDRLGTGGLYQVNAGVALVSFAGFCWLLFKRRRIAALQTE